MSKANAIRNLFTSPLGIDEVAFIYLGYSGVIIRTYKHTLVVDPADLLNVEEIYEQRSIHLLLFTHSHGDHYSLRPTLGIFKATGVPIIAESLVASDLMGKVPRDKLVAATPGKTYTFGEIHVDVIQGIHRGPINLYRIGVDKIRIFHAGDSGYVPLRDYPADLAFLPTGSPSPTASPDYALKMALDLKPSVAVAIHGSESQNKEFEAKMKTNMPDVQVIKAEPYISRTLIVAKR